MNGETLKIYARNHGYGNNRLAASMGITSQNLSQQLAKDDIRTSLLERVAAVIGVSPADIYGGSVTNSTSIVGIGSVTDGMPADGSIYDLQGRRLDAAPQRGIYIINGRKRVK